MSQFFNEHEIQSPAGNVSCEGSCGKHPIRPSYTSCNVKLSRDLARLLADNSVTCDKSD